MSWLSKALGTHQSKAANPANAANQYLNQIPAQMLPYFQPYMNQGQQAGQQLTGQYNQMTQNPQEFFKNISGGYKESPGYQFKLQQALNAGNNAAAAGGMLGTPQHQQQNMGVAEGLANQDYQDYLNHILGIFGQGQQGQQGLQEQGFRAGTGYGENIGNILGQQAQYAFGGQAGQNAAQGQNRSNLFSGIGSLLPYIGNYFSK